MAAADITFAAITVLTLGDETAKIVGKKLGRRALLYNKTKQLEGTLAGIIVSAAASLFITPFKAVAASVTSMVAESPPLPVDDNFTIPLTLIPVTQIFSLLSAIGYFKDIFSSRSTAFSSSFHLSVIFSKEINRSRLRM